jgi:phenylpropionate dioxygenase-like ring-hydroxylating dioxygenase large terminal subunit
MAYDIRTVGAHPDHWYPLAWADEIAPGKVIGREFAGAPIALFRTKAGLLTALEDRCAHRQVPLHLGVVAGETLKCGYHGWSYDRQGACVDVPYLGECRVANGVKSYPVREVNGMVLVFPGNPALADARLPALGRSADGAYRTRRLNREVACHYSFLHENLFDMNHQFLHRKNMGSIKARCLGRRGGETWSEVDYTFSRTAGRQSVGEAAILTVRTEYPYQHLRVWVGDPAAPPALDVWLCYTPLGTDQRRNRTFGFLSVKKAKIPGLTALAWPFIAWFTERIFQEDKVIVEAEQQAHDMQGADWNNEIFPAINDLRALLVRCGTPPAAKPHVSAARVAQI